MNEKYLKEISKNFLEINKIVSYKGEVSELKKKAKETTEKQKKPKRPHIRSITKDLLPIFHREIQSLLQ